MRIKEYTQTVRNIQETIESRYYNTGLVEDEGLLFRTTYTPKTMETKDSDTYIQVRADETGRLDLFAARVYKNPRLYWVIAEANNILDPIEEVTAGTVLRVPKFTESLNVR